MEYIWIYLIAFVITASVYFFWYKGRNNYSQKLYLKWITFFASVYAIVITVVIMLEGIENQLSVVIFVIAVSLIEDNIFIPLFFKEGNLNFKKIDKYLPGLCSNVLIFGIVYYLFYL